MNNLEINYKIKIKANFTPEQWCLGYHDDPYVLTNQLNSWLEYYVNSAFSRADIENNIGVILKSYDCHNVEPLQFLVVVLDEIFES
jgi:hypothetical protein